jgi:hypothetical protein
MQNPISNVVFLASYVRSKSPAEAAPAASETPVSAQPKQTAPRRSRRSSASSMEDVHDDEIVERVALGDLEAAAALRLRYIGRLRRAATPILGDEGEVARVVESVLACSGWPPQRGELDRWLMRLVRRAAVARKRALWGLDSSHVPESRRRRDKRLGNSRLRNSRPGNRH